MQSKNKFFITIIFLLILIYGCKTTNSDTTDTGKKQNYSQAEYFNIAGNTAKEKKDGTRAIYYYTKAIETDTDYIEAYLNRGEMYYYVNEHEKALADFHKVIELSPKEDKAYYWKGLVYEYLKQYESSLVYLNKAIQLNDKNYKYYELRSLVYKQLREYDKAYNDVNIAIKLNQNNGILYSLRGLLNEYLNKYNDAIIDYKKSIALMPEFIAPYKSLLSIYLQTQNYEAGLEVADKAINIEQSWILYSTRGYLFLMLQSYNEAISDSNRAIKLNSGFADSYLTRGKAYLALKEYKKAIEDFDMAIKLDPDNIDKVKQEAIEYKQKAYEALAKMERK